MSTHVASHVAYVVSRFPKVSETFIVDEILALERQGVTVSVYTLAAGRDEVVQPDAAELARRATVLGLTSPRWLFAQLYWLVRRPACVLDIWLRMVVEHLRAPRQLLRACVAIAHAAHFARCMQRDGVHHVHAHWATHTALTAWAIHRLNGIPYSFTAHADDIYVRRPMLEEKVQGADFVITISDYNRRFLAKQLGAEGVERVRVVHCGVASGSFRPAPLPQSNTPLVIACVARLEGKKGHVHLLDACAKLIRRGVALRCLLVGDGPERRAIEHQRDALGLNEHVTLLGAQPRSRVREVLVDANVVVLPGVVMPSGRADGIPVALMEAMAIQRPVVASAISGIPELVEHERTGLLVPPGDPDALADALHRLQLEPGLAKSLAEAGRRRVLAEFDIDRNVDQLRGFFEHGRRPEPVLEPLTAVNSSVEEAGPLWRS